MANPIKLHYFDFRGRGEIIRLVLTLAGQPFEDIRWTREEFAGRKAESPFGQVPFIEYKGKKYGQSHAIAGFLANEFSLCGRSNLDRLRIDEISGLCQDLVSTLVKGHMEKDETKKAELLKAEQEEVFPKFFGYLLKLLRENSTNGVFIGRELTLADLYVYDQMFNLAKFQKLDAAAKYTELKALQEKVEANPRIQAYLAKRKDTIF